VKLAVDPTIVEPVSNTVAVVMMLLGGVAFGRSYKRHPPEQMIHDLEMERLASSPL